jgi:hypothetical protein
MLQAELSKLVKFYGHKIDIHSEVDSDYNRGLRLAYSISKYMTQQVIYEILDRELSKSIEGSGESLSG